MLHYVFRAHKPSEWSLSSGHETDDMDQKTHLFHNLSKSIAPCVLPCPKTQEHQSTCVDSWVHRVPENGHQPLGRGNSLWRSACPIL